MTCKGCSDLQEAVAKLNRLNDELVVVEKQLNEELGISLLQSTGSSRQEEDPEPNAEDIADQEANLTTLVHDQAIVVANLTDEVSRLKIVVRNDTVAQNEAAREYADAVADLENATKDIEETNGTLTELRAQGANASKAAANATFRYQIAAGQFAFGNQTFEANLYALLAMRQAVQNATDTELQAQLDCGKAKITWATFSELLVEQTSRLQEEMDRLNLLNDELLQVQSSLHRGGAQSGAPTPLQWNPVVLIFTAVTWATMVRTAGA